MDSLAVVRLAHGELSRAVIGAYFEVYNLLGWGLRESVYQCALPIALKRRGVSCRREVVFAVHFLGERVGEYRADIVVDETIIVETKCVERLAPAHTAQLLTYLKASGLPLGLLLNFGPEAQFRRILSRELLHPEDHLQSVPTLESVVVGSTALGFRTP